MIVQIGTNMRTIATGVIADFLVYNWKHRACCHFFKCVNVINNKTQWKTNKNAGNSLLDRRLGFKIMKMFVEHFDRQFVVLIIYCDSLKKFLTLSVRRSKFDWTHMNLSGTERFRKNSTNRIEKWNLCLFFKETISYELNLWEYWKLFSLKISLKYHLSLYEINLFVTKSKCQTNSIEI